MKPLGTNDPCSAGRHRLLAVIGQGAMGRVLLGRAPDGRLVAVKMVHRQLARSPEFRARFRMEVQASQRVTGAYTAAVMDADPDAPEPWLASMYVPGPSLREAVEELGPLPLGGLRLLTAGLAAALLEIHRAGMIHRDLKPANVLLGADGPRVIDFGIARALETQTQLTSTGSLIGSPAFMSPEQAEGHDLTTASDVFSVGGMLVLAATGRHPFPGESTPQTLYNVVHTRADTSGVPPELRPVVDACLDKNPAHRPTAAQLLDVAGRITAQPVWPVGVRQRIADSWGEAQQWAALPDTVLDSPPRRRVSRRLLAGLAGVLAVVAAAGVGVYVLERPQPSPPVHLAITTDQMRLVDTCKLLGADVIGSVGSTGATKPFDSGTCETTVLSGGGTANVSLEVGDDPVPANQKNTGDTAGGFPVLDTTGEGSVLGAQACSRVIFPAVSPKVPIGVSVSGGEKQCDLATSILKLVVNRLATAPPMADLPTNSIVRMDPCASVDAKTISTALGATAAPSAAGVHDCEWTSPDYQLSVSLSVTDQPANMDGTYPPDRVEAGSLGPLQVVRHTDTASQPYSAQFSSYYVANPAASNQAEIVLVIIDAKPKITAAQAYQRMDPVLEAVVTQQRKQ
ncbi:serine/threonine-protein kinase [Nocardia macrotermitis]|uniref:Serine/threonine-protein kinase PknD n=1 Tax=Nocardia macrotermitis TaxID=2585198 RepID=A0A7K0D0I8_9NOCA|nr:serine/threonine-protein kinase [Nocardia macrotermitis]MQY19230.1 Serine/threonine-protein kinase PknD [Nocardia macrotermitis]